MEGCIDGATCVDGTCVANARAKALRAGKTCRGDTDCPDFQTCIEGGCYSDCTEKDQCGAGMTCHKRVCHKLCETANPACGEREYCASDDGVSGVCRALRQTAGERGGEVSGTFTVTPERAMLSNLLTSGRLTITNSSPEFVRFVVRKRSHSVPRANGGLDKVVASDACATNPSACPLFWLELNGGKLSEIEVPVQANGTAEVALSNAGGFNVPRWNGELEIYSARLGSRTFTLNYAERPEGRWSGSLFYLANFPTGKMEEWRAARNGAEGYAKGNAVENALIRRWVTFRDGKISWDEFKAVLLSLRTESWRFENVKKACAKETTAAACYPFVTDEGGGTGIAELSASLESNPVPTGLTEMPFAINIHQPDPEGQPEKMKGRIDTATALQYPGNPELSLTFGASPTRCELEDPKYGTCLTFVRDLSATIAIGGRYVAQEGLCSGAGFESAPFPWLVPGFQRATTLDAKSGQRYRTECRDGTLPNGATASGKLMNLELASANPVPDGRARFRAFTVVDGAMINQSQLFLLVEERFDSFWGADDPKGFRAYAFIVLERDRSDLDLSDTAPNNGIPDLFEGSPPPSGSGAAPPAALGATCSPALLSKVLPKGGALNAANAASVAELLIDGVAAPGVTANALTDASPEKPHFLCVDTDEFDGGQNGTPCPAKSEVRFFTANQAVLSSIAYDSCGQVEGHTDTCAKRLAEWIAAKKVMQVEPRYKCESASAVPPCDEEERVDLREGKVFFAKVDPVTCATPAKCVQLNPFRVDLDSAFRYKMRYRTSEGAQLGYVPKLCDATSNIVPYCYDPALIEELRDRNDCLLSIWESYVPGFGVDEETLRVKLQNHLAASFSDYASPESYLGIPKLGEVEGHEKLYAELLIMFGDDAYTAAFASRFDLANSRTQSFEGTLFEKDGLNLSGVAGLEMFSLYQAAQYYQEAIDRFYGVSSLLWKSVRLPSTRDKFVIAPTVRLYFDRLIRASTQKSRAMSEIGRRYLSFNRPDLARRVIERAYSAMYLESIVMSRMMLELADLSKPADRPDIARAVEEAQRTYRMAALDMRNAYTSITDQTTHFGFALDFVPLPALGPQDVNAFRVVLARAQQKTAIARGREDQALAEARSYAVDSADFQAQLVGVRNAYESQLGELCGTFTTSDGRVWPATKKYVDLMPPEVAAIYGDPCGFVGNGRLHAAMEQIALLGLNVNAQVQRYDNVLAAVAIERRRVSEQCALTEELADYVFMQGQEEVSIEQEISMAEKIQMSVDIAMEMAATAAEMTKCVIGISGTDCGTGTIAAGVYEIAMGVEQEKALWAEEQISELEQQKALMELDSGHWITMQECTAATIDSKAKVDTMLLELKSIDIDTLKAKRELGLGMSTFSGLSNEARRLLLEHADAEELALEAQAARNDPNVRIYRNDAILNADFSFQDAIREAYRATKVFEYYTSQSYAALEKLFITRMVARGQENLENYLIALENAFNDFEQDYGRPDTRVAVVSLRDDILKVPRLAVDGTALSDAERIAMLRGALADVANLDADGYTSFPFGTEMLRVSPLTRNHKVLAIEAELVGSDLGDEVARVYLRQSGTGVVKTVAGEKLYYRLPERTAVLNPFFNGARPFTEEVYRNERMRDRPFVNSGWELILNQRDEQENRDLNLQSLSDVRLYLYYTDFTAF